jgi:hypothetical protein
MVTGLMVELVLFCVLSVDAAQIGCQTPDRIIEQLPL